MRDAGRSARQQYRQAKAARSRLRQSGIFRVAYGLGLSALGMFIAKVPLQEQWPSVLAIGAAVLALYVAFLRWPQEFLTLTVVAGWVLVCPAVTWLVVAVTPELLTDYTARITALALYGGLIGFLSIKYRNGHLPWLTCLISLVSTAAVATVFYHLGWSGGLWLGYAVGLLVVGLRGGGWDRLMDTWDWLVERKPLSGAKSKTEDEKPVDPEEQWAADAKAEIATAKLLTRLPKDYVILHDRRVPGEEEYDATIDHVVIGPTGLFVVDSAMYSGKISKRSNGRLWNGDRPMDMTLLTVFWKAQVVATKTNLPASAILAIHGATMPSARAQVGLFTRQSTAEQARTGDIVVIDAKTAGPTLLGEILSDRGVAWSRGEVHRYARRVRRAFPSATEPVAPGESSAAADSDDLWPSDIDDLRVDGMNQPDGDSRSDRSTASRPDVSHAMAGTRSGVTEAGDLGSPMPAAEDLPVHREYQWGLSEEADELARENMYDIERCELKPGDHVHSMRPDEMLTNWVVLTKPYLHEVGEGGTPVVDIAEAAEATRAEAEGRQADFVAEPISRVILA